MSCFYSIIFPVPFLFIFFSCFTPAKQEEKYQPVRGLRYPEDVVYICTSLVSVRLGYSYLGRFKCRSEPGQEFFFISATKMGYLILFFPYRFLNFPPNFRSGFGKFLYSFTILVFKAFLLQCQSQFSIKHCQNQIYE